MYKSKFGIWSLMIVIMVVIAIITNQISLPKFMHKETYKVYSNIDDTSFANYIADTSHFKIVSNMNDADIIILAQDDNKNINGFTKYYSSMYSPIVMYMQITEENKEEFVDLNVNTSIGKDYYSILTAFENNGNYSDLGITSKSLTGEIQIVIPNENSYYYDEVVDTIYYALNGNKIPTETEKNELEKRVNNILDKCIKVDDVQSELTKYSKEGTKSYCNMIFVAPENIFFRANYQVFSTSEKYGFDIVYNTASAIVLKYDVYVTNRNENAVEIYKNFASYDAHTLIGNNSIPNITGYRITNYENYTIEGSSHVLPVVQIANN